MSNRNTIWKKLKDVYELLNLIDSKELSTINLETDEENGIDLRVDDD